MQNLKVKSNSASFVSKRELCADTWEYTFSYTKNLHWNPGDYTYITLPPKKTSDSRGLRRHISIVNLPNRNNHIKFAVRLRDSAFKKTLHSLLTGETIEFTVPYGELRFPKDKNSHMVFIVGGIGITAVLNVLERIKNENLEHSVTILYFNKSLKTTAYLDEIEDLQQTLPLLTVHICMTQDATWIGEKGRVSDEKIKNLIKSYQSAYFYTVGPESLNQAVEDILFDLNIPDEQIWREDFTGY
ncbi:MAG TPA: FAD-dependent oxidoreductase [Candidatus Levybacteria bacterium]|nr:FAD-dependent oxidoreductase [Candidatus Levybacteria bacterium]